MAHKAGVICLLALSAIVLASASVLVRPRRRDCASGHVKCWCGGRRHVKVAVPVRRCKRFDGYSEYCEDCTPRKQVKKRVCPKFRHCKSCVSDRCATCPDNKYGRFCNESCSSLCQNGGTCRNNTCVCPRDYTGIHCEKVKDKDCLVVTKPANGDVTVTGKTATYTCAAGYILIGQKILKCKSDGTWSSEAPVCEAICITPNASKHLFFTRQELYEDDEYEGAVMKISARCDDGYRLVGARAVYCNLIGTWSSLPRCVKRGKCIVPHNILNGSVQSYEEDYYEGAEVTYECDLGFVLNGSFSLKCLETGTWSDNPPRCVAELSSRVICPSPGKPANGSFMDGSESKTHQYVPGVRVVYSCDEGFFLHPSRSDFYCLHDGTWLPAKPPKCVRVITCPDPGIPVNGKRCFGYLCSDPNNHGSTHTCISIAKVGNEKITLPEGSYVVGTRVEFTCNNFYRIVATSFIRCGEDGTWTDVVPRCLPECGRVTRGITGFISRGQDAPAEKWPWHVIVKSRSGEFCGGVLLGDSWVLTAAHCVVNVNAASLRTEFGKQNMNDSSSSDGVQIRKIKSIHSHGSYWQERYDSDIALLQLEKPVKTTSRVRPVCLSPKSFPACMPNTDPNRSDNLDMCGSAKMNENTPNRSDRINSYITGFGATNQNPTSNSRTLQSAAVVIENNKTRCREVLEKQGARSEITRNMFCAGLTSQPCAGDSGGPLVIQPKDNSGISKWYLQGVVSWGPTTACMRNESYGVFTNVTIFYDWIKNLIPDLVYYN